MTRHESPRRASQNCPEDDTPAHTHTHTHTTRTGMSHPVAQNRPEDVLKERTLRQSSFLRAPSFSRATSGGSVGKVNNLLDIISCFSFWGRFFFSFAVSTIICGSVGRVAHLFFAECGWVECWKRALHLSAIRKTVQGKRASICRQLERQCKGRVRRCCEVYFRRKDRILLHTTSR